MEEPGGECIARLNKQTVCLLKMSRNGLKVLENPCITNVLLGLADNQLTVKIVNSGGAV